MRWAGNGRSEGAAAEHRLGPAMACMMCTATHSFHVLWLPCLAARAGCNLVHGCAHAHAPSALAVRST
eukprot:4670829-Amphidinium_carterae.1